MCSHATANAFAQSRQTHRKEYPLLSSVLTLQVYIKESPPSCFDVKQPNVTQGGVLVKKCGLSFEEICRYKYVLNIGSNGYANKLKYLFLTGSVVIWVSRLITLMTPRHTNDSSSHQ